MDDGLTIDASAYTDDQYPLKAGDWVASGEPLIRVAQVRRVYRDSAWAGRPSDGFLVDLVLYDFSGNKIGRESSNEPYVYGGKRVYGPRSFEPCVPLHYWYRIETPEFPIRFGAMDLGNGKAVYGYYAKKRPWGKYVRRKKSVKPLPVVSVKISDFDPELERRARLLAAEKLRDLARERGDDELRRQAELLEEEARRMTGKD